MLPIALVTLPVACGIQLSERMYPAIEDHLNSNREIKNEVLKPLNFGIIPLTLLKDYPGRSGLRTESQISESITYDKLGPKKK